MPPPNHSSLPSPDFSIEQLRDTVAGLSAQVADLQRRLSNLEHSRASSISVPVPPELLSAKPQLESNFGLKVVNRAGAITLAIGIIFFFKYAVDNRWIGAEGRVWLGLIAGVAMIAAAAWMRRSNSNQLPAASDSNVFSQGIAGCGLATIYVSLYAAFALYKLLLPWAGWSLLIALSAAAVAISLRFKSPVIAALGFTSGLLTPVLLHNNASAAWFDFLYLLLLGVTSILIAVRQRWPVLIPAIAPLTLFSAVYIFNVHFPGWLAAFAFCLGFAYFSAMRYAAEDRTLKLYTYLAGHACLLVGGLRAITFLDLSINELASLLLAFYGLALLIWGFARRSELDRSLGLSLLGVVIAKLYVWDVWQLDRVYRVFAFVVLGILLLVASYLYSCFRSRTTS